MLTYQVDHDEKGRVTRVTVRQTDSGTTVLVYPDRIDVAAIAGVLVDISRRADAVSILPRPLADGEGRPL